MKFYHAYACDSFPFIKKLYFYISFSYYYLFSISFEKSRTMYPMRAMRIKIALRILVFYKDSPSKMKLKTMERITPVICPPKIRIPEAVA